MLALTYPDGARVQRCDYLPENPALSSSLDTNFNVLRIKSQIPFEAISPSIYESSPYNDCALSIRRRLRRERIRRKNKKTFNNGPRAVSSISFGQESCDMYNNELRYEFKCEKSTEEDNEPPSSRESSQSTSTTTVTTITTVDAHRLSIFNIDKESAETRRRELPGRESWPGGSHAKDRHGQCSFLQIILILLLIIIGSNRHCGPFGSRVMKREAIGAVFAFGTVVGGVGSAPVDIINDAGVRSERSANLSHITGTSRKIQMYIKHRHLQILPDGTVNGSNDDTSDYTILQRNSVSRGQLRIQGVATCLYLCMDSCGLLYGSREYTGDCVFNETLEQHNYNTYSSAHWSTPRKTLYLGLTGQGQPRRVQAKGHNLGRLSAYARVLTKSVPQDRVEALHRRMLGAKHNVRHHHGGNTQQNLCPTQLPQEKDGRDKFRCRKRKKRKKRRRKCRAGETPGAQCDLRDGHGLDTQSKRSCEGEAFEEACRKEALDAPAKKRKSRIEEEEDDAADIDDDVVVEKKIRRSNSTSEPAKERGQKKKGRKSSSVLTTNNNNNNNNNSNKKLGNKKKKSSSPSSRAANDNNNNNSSNKNGKNSNKLSRKKGQNGFGRFARTTHRLSSSPAMTSPISFYPVSTSPTSIEQSFVSSQVFDENGQTRSNHFNDRPKSSSSSSSAVSAVSVAATSLASTLTLTVASGEVFSENGTSSAGDARTESIIDLEEFVGGKEFNDEDEEEDEEDDEDNDRSEFTDARIGSKIAKDKIEIDQRLAM